MASVSIILPAYNEGARIGPTLRRIIAHLEKRKHHYEIIVVDDGSVDDTARVVRRCGNARTRIIGLPQNHGKGFAVKTGMLEAKQQYVLFSDADLATPIEELEALLRQAKKGADVVIASRNMRTSKRVIKQPFYRRVLGRVFPWFVSAFVIRGFKDTQCGFKLFRRDAARQIAQRQTVDRFAFDVEMLFLAKQLGYRIKEVPVVWVDQQGTTVHPLRDGLRMLRDITRIRYNHVRGRYTRARLPASARM